MSFSEALAFLRMNHGGMLTRNKEGAHIVLDRNGKQIYPIADVASGAEPVKPELKRLMIREQVRSALMRSDVVLLEEQGARLIDLIYAKTRAINPDEEKFCAMCMGEAEPFDPISLPWKKFCIEEAFRRANLADNLLGDPGKLVLNDYQSVVERFKLLAEQGHRGALRWLEKEEIQFATPTTTPNLNLRKALFFPLAGSDSDLFDSGRMVRGGSPGAGRPTC